MTALSYDCQFLLCLYLLDRGNGISVKEISLAASTRFPRSGEIPTATAHVTVLSLRAQQLVEVVEKPARVAGDGRGRSAQPYCLTKLGIDEARKIIRTFAEILLESTGIQAP